MTLIIVILTINLFSVNNLMINIQICLLLLILILLIYINIIARKENFNASFPVYGDSTCDRICSNLEQGYNYGYLCRCKKCCEDSGNCNPTYSRLLDYFDWADGKDCNFND